MSLLIPFKFLAIVETVVQFFSEVTCKSQSFTNYVSGSGLFLFSLACRVSGSGLTPCLSTDLSSYFIDSGRIYFFEELHFKLALFMQPISSSSFSM